MKKKAWRVILLPLMVLILLFTAERMNLWGEEEQPVSETNPEKNDSSDHQKNPEEKEIPEGYTQMTLVVGKLGSMEDKDTKVPIYKEPDPNCAQLVGRLEYNCAVVAGENQNASYSENWICVELPGTEEGEGYIRRDAEIQIAEVAFGSEDPFYNAVIQDALACIGRKFVPNGDSLTEGIDCSHFTALMYEKNGVEIPVKALNQRKKGTVVITSDQRTAKTPGHIIYYDRANNGSGHVGIYLGDGGVDHPEDYAGGFIINSTGHSGRTYPEGGVRIVCLLYPDRDHYEELEFDTEEGDRDE